MTESNNLWICILSNLFLLPIKFHKTLEQPRTVSFSPFHTPLLLPGSRISWTSFVWAAQSIQGLAVVQQTLEGSQIWAQVPGPSQILGKPGTHTHTQGLNSFQRNGSNSFLPFPCLQLLDLARHFGKNRDNQREPRNIEMVIVMITGSHQCHQHSKKRIVPPKVKKNF